MNFNLCLEFSNNKFVINNKSWKKETTFVYKNFSKKNISQLKLIKIELKIYAFLKKKRVFIYNIIFILYFFLFIRS